MLAEVVILSESWSHLPSSLVLREIQFFVVVGLEPLVPRAAHCSLPDHPLNKVAVFFKISGEHLLLILFYELLTFGQGYFPSN